MLETLKGATFEYVVFGYKFSGNNIIVILKNFKKIGIKLSFLLSQLMEKDVCFLTLNEPVSAYMRNRGGKLSNLTFPQISRILEILF